jgi:hypothetical protein
MSIKKFKESKDEKIDEAIQMLKEVYKYASDKTKQEYSKLFAASLSIPQRRMNPIYAKNFTFYPEKSQLISKIKQHPNIHLPPLHAKIFYCIAKHSMRGKAINHSVLHHLVYSDDDMSTTRISSNITGINKKIKPLGLSIHHKKRIGWFIKKIGEEN